MTGVDAGVNLYAGRTNEGRFFPQKKPRIASSVSRVFRNEDTSRGIDISHPAGDDGASPMTSFNLSDAAVPVNCSASGVSAQERNTLGGRKWRRVKHRICRFSAQRRT